MHDMSPDEGQKYNLINFGYNPWSPFWKRNQTIVHLLSQAGLFNEALFINKEVWVSNLLFNMRSECKIPQKYNWSAIWPRKVTERITVYTPLKLPFESKNNPLTVFNKKITRTFMEKRTLKPAVVIVNNPCKAIMEYQQWFKDKDIVWVFDWSDDFREFTSNEAEKKEVDRLCEHFIRSSQLVLTVNNNLEERARKINPNSHVIANATNYFAFEQAVGSEVPEPLRRFDPHRPLIGYVGWLNSLRLDAELIEYLACSKPSWEFVYLGPKSDPNPLGSRVHELKNVHILEAVPYPQMIRYLKAFSCCILPNRLNAHTRGNDPLKLYDYLASGKPVVSTPTAGTEGYKDLIAIESQKEDFLNAVEEGMAANSEAASERRVRIARDNSWGERIKDVISLLRPHMNKYQTVP